MSGGILVQKSRLVDNDTELLNEARDLIEFSLDNILKNDEPDGIKTADCYKYLAQLYYKIARIQTSFDSIRSYLVLSKSSYEEGYRIHKKIYGSAHKDTVKISSELAEIEMLLKGD